MNNLSNMIRNKRYEKNISQRELAMLSNIDRTTLSEIENGIRRKPKIDTLVKLANSLGIPLATLLYSAGYNYEQINRIIDIDNKVKKESDYYLNEFQIVISGECIVKAKSKDKAEIKFEKIINNLLLALAEENEKFQNLYNHSDIEIYTNVYQIDVKEGNE